MIRDINKPIVLANADFSAIEDLPKIPRRIKMTTGYYNKLMNNSFVLKKTTSAENGYFGIFNGIPIDIDDEIEFDYELVY